MHHPELVIDDKAYVELRDECEVIFDTHQRLPQQVFRRKFEEYYVFEHGMILHPNFPSFLERVAHQFGDSIVNYITFEPSSKDYYHKNFGFYGLASFEIGALKYNYRDVMLRGNNADSFFARGGDVGAFWGSSLSWGIFCDRINWETCLMGCSMKIDNSTTSTVGVMDMTQFGNYLANQYQHRPMVATNFSAEFKKNYLDFQ